MDDDYQAGLELEQQLFNCFSFLKVDLFQQTLMNAKLPRLQISLLHVLRSCCEHKSTAIVVSCEQWSVRRLAGR
jgi:hypothetical protein